MSDGSVDSFAVNNNSTVTMSGGSVAGGLVSYDNSIVTMSGGSVGTLASRNNSTVTVYGGSVGDMRIGDNSTVTVSGGSIVDVLIGDNSIVTVSGGTFALGLQAVQASTVTISGGIFEKNDGANFIDSSSGSFTLIGNNLMATNIGPDSVFGGTDYALSGTLQSGTDLTGYVLDVLPGGNFTLQPVAVPEPSSVAFLIGMSVMSNIWRCRRRQLAS